MHQANITFELEYINSRLSPTEIHPRIACFLDSSFKRKSKVVHLKQVGNRFQVQVTGVSTEEPGRNSALCFQYMAWRANGNGNPCLLDVGTAHVTFDEIYKGIRQHQTFKKDIDMIMHTANNLNKGTFRITIDEKNFDAPSYRQVLGDPINVQKNGLKQYSEDVLTMEQQMQDLLKGTENMRMPFDYSESGLQSTGGIPLPAVAYVLCETPESNTMYWTNAYNNIMKRDGLKPEEWNILSLVGKARTTVLTCCYISHYLDYVSDTVDTNIKGQLYKPQGVRPYENFGDALAMFSGDCEDLASVILQCVNSFISHNFPKDSRYDKFREMQTIAKSYVPALSLDTVKGAQVSDQVQNLGAHMNTNFIPATMFRDWIENTREGRRQTESLPWGKEYQKEELPFLVGEGTGMYEPLGFDYPMMDIMQYVYRAPSLNSFKKPILHHKQETGPFFLGSLVGLTDYFYRRGASAPTGFWYTTKQGTTLKRGVLYEDMMKEDHEKIAIKLHPEVPPAVMKDINVAISRRIPPRPLILTKTHDHVHNKQLDYIVANIGQLKRPPGPKSQYVPLYVRPHQLTDNVANRMVDEFGRLNRIWKVEYDLESITDEIWGYRVKVFVN